MATILDIRYDNLTQKSALNEVARIMEQREKSSLFFLNIDCLQRAHKDKYYGQILRESQLVLPDGIGLRLASLLFGFSMKENCNGTDFVPLFLKEVAKKQYKIFLLGAQEGIAAQAAENLMKNVKEVRIVGVHHGYFKDSKQIIDSINESQADILLVALGAPIQEKWVYENRQKINATLCVGVGALFDFWSERIPRAPAVFRKIHLEWFWRLSLEPTRLFKRYLIDDLGFLIYLIGCRLINYKVSSKCQKQTR